ncbi:hypothetical protein JMM63_20440 [Rhodovulum sulfidophilum]|uniref:hypothetical protein n=1 Tax=Rhodovulum sulfidophilum TaxID=35806 RepID=UPI001922BE34|nr:hypothetical protein [Rhodovulum sulfidophilum]MBL3597889.1 hypothetical protein [Rhodovulum sulfidophilum]
MTGGPAPAVSKRRANKEECERHKLLVELPKVGITVVAFFATTSALILRLAPGSGIVPQVVLRPIFFIGIALTLWMFVRAYGYIAEVTQNAGKNCSDKEREDKFEHLMEDDYLRFKKSLEVCVVAWLFILLGFVLLA